MSLKSVSLDPFFLAGIYHAPIIPAASRQVSLEPEKVGFLGNNERNILLIIHNEQEAYLEERLFSFLTKILEACGHSMADVALVNLAKMEELDFLTLQSQFAPLKTILFGTELLGTSANAHPKNRIWEEQHSLIFHTDTLAAMIGNDQLKSSFWIALKQLFHIN